MKINGPYRKPICQLLQNFTASKMGFNTDFGALPASLPVTGFEKKHFKIHNDHQRV